MSFCREAGSDTLVPAHLLYAVWNELDYLAGYHQQDAHEFLIAFLDGMDKHVRDNHSTSSLSSTNLPNTKIPALSLPCPGVGLSDLSPGVRKSPRSESKSRVFAFGAGSLTSPTLLRRSISEVEPSSAGSAGHVTSPCVEILDVRTESEHVRRCTDIGSFSNCCTVPSFRRYSVAPWSPTSPVVPADTKASSRSPS